MKHYFIRCEENQSSNECEKMLSLFGCIICKAQQPLPNAFSSKYRKCQCFWTKKASFKLNYILCEVSNITFVLLLYFYCYRMLQELLEIFVKFTKEMDQTRTGCTTSNHSEVSTNFWSYLDIGFTLIVRIYLFINAEFYDIITNCQEFIKMWQNIKETERLSVRSWSFTRWWTQIYRRNMLTVFLNSISKAYTANEPTLWSCQKIRIISKYLSPA